VYYGGLKQPCYSLFLFLFFFYDEDKPFIFSTFTESICILAYRAWGGQEMIKRDFSMSNKEASQKNDLSLASSGFTNTKRVPCQGKGPLHLISSVVPLLIICYRLCC
jgi:hypothetical protein